MHRGSRRILLPLSAAGLLTLIGVDAARRLADAAQLEPAARAPIDTTLLKSYRWRSIGPDRGGRSIAVSGVKGRPREGYFGATGGGLWKTMDGGQAWAPVTDGQ